MIDTKCLITVLAARLVVRKERIPRKYDIQQASHYDRVHVGEQAEVCVECRMVRIVMKPSGRMRRMCGRKPMYASEQ